ncbi:MAG: hypothetical protein Q9192_002379, partial [Flavoplaca navasiana]
MGSSHSKPQKPVRKNQISYPRTQAHSHPLHAYGHSHPQPHPKPQPVHQARHSKGSWRHPEEPQFYGTSRVIAYGKAKSVYLPEVQYYGTFPDKNSVAPRTTAAKKPIQRKPLPSHPSRSQVNYYSKRALPPTPGSRAAVRSQQV